MINMRMFIFFAASFLISCSGGGGSSSTTSSTTSYSGVAIDGYLSLATVCLDLNDNGSCDANEPSATTDSTGGFTIYATQDQINSHSVIGKAIAGKTIDLDSPGAAITGDMTLTVPTGKHSVVSPLTTLVQAKVEAGQTLAASITAVQTELGLTTIDPMKNYVSEKVTNSAYADAHKIAASIAEILKTIESGSTSSTTLSNKLSSLTSSVTTNLAPIATQIKSASSLDDARTAINNSIAEAAKIFTIGGSVSGLLENGLILINGTNTVNVNSASTSFVFSAKKATGGTYAVTVQSNPTGQTCSVSNGSGSVSNQSISNISITCIYNPGGISGTITGLVTSGLVLKNGSSELSVSSGANTFQFGSTFASGSAYSVTVKTQPTGLTCAITNSSGTMTYLGVSNLQISCSHKLTSPSRIIAFGDAFSTVNSNGYATYSVNTAETDGTVASQIATYYGFTLKNRISPSMIVSSGNAYSYASGAATSSDTASQISSYLANNTPGSNDLFIITVGTQDIAAAAPSNNISAIATATTVLTNAIQSLTTAGAQFVLVMQPINLARTPPFLSGAYSSYSTTAKALSYDSGALCQSFTCQLTTKLDAAYPPSLTIKPILLVDLTSYFNLLTGTTSTGSANTFAIYNVSNPDVNSCTTAPPNCTSTTVTTGTNAYTSANWDFSNSIFAYDYYLTPFANRLLASYIYNTNMYGAGWR
jgi:hypothetical protein